MKRLSSRMPLMTASLALAFLLWLLVIAEEKIEAGFMVPLVFENIPASVVVDGPPMGSVYVQIRGSKQAVENILPQQVRARVDLAQAEPGDKFVQITPKNIFLPQGVVVLGIYPPYLDLKFHAKRPVPVKVLTIGKPAEGYEVRQITTIPLQVEVVGPLASVQSIKQVETYPVDVSGLKKNLRARVEFVQPGDDIRLLQLKPTEVVVEVVPRKVEKTFRGVSVDAGGDERSFSPASVTIVVRGDYNRLKEMESGQVKVEVDWSAAESDSPQRALRVQVPQGLAVVSVKPGSVKIK
jgi:YbbR domain-containing protein